MICRIADIVVEVPEAGGMAPRCKDYLYKGGEGPHIVISEDDYRLDAWVGFSEESYVYMETGSHFHASLLHHEGLMLHASAISFEGKAYLFSGPCGMGKSTHTRLWRQCFGESAIVFNDDKPALRFVGGRWHAYGTPWCGKDGINVNMKVPLVGICFLKQADRNAIRRLERQEASQKVICQTMHRLRDPEKLDLMLSHVDKLVREIPVFEMENRPVLDAARLSYATMRRAAEEAGL